MRERVAWVFHKLYWLDCDKYLGILSVPLNWRDGRWFLGDEVPRVLPCAAPNLISSGSDVQPLIRILDEKGEVVYQHRKASDPRIVLSNRPSETPTFLKELSFDLRLPLIDGMAWLEFYDPLEEPNEPAISVNLRDVIDKYWEAGGPDQEAVCQDPEYGGEEPPKY